MSVVNEILRVSSVIDFPRTIESVFHHLESEIDELADEIVCGGIGEDGIIGEAVDVILCAVDIIYKHQPNVIEADIMKVVQRKLNKWQAVYGRSK